MTAAEDGTPGSEIRYTAYGETRWVNGVTVTDQRYTGQREEKEIGLDYYVARFYDPFIAHFIQADAIISSNTTSTGLDRYVYVDNCPINKNDPTGHCPICITIIAGSVISAAISYGSQVVTNISDNGFSGESFTQVNWESVGVAALGGAVAGATGFAIGAAAAAIGGTGLVASVAGGTIGGAVSGQTSRAMTNIVTGQKWSNGLGNARDLISGAAIGGISAGLGYEIGKLAKGVGNYSDTGGHHIHQQSAYNGAENYNAKGALSIGQDFIKQNNWSHKAISSAQRTLQNNLYLSGVSNTNASQTRIAYQTLRAGGVGRIDSFFLSAWSRLNLYNQGVKAPIHIPWH